MKKIISSKNEVDKLNISDSAEVNYQPAKQNTANVQGLPAANISPTPENYLIFGEFRKLLCQNTQTALLKSGLL